MVHFGYEIFFSQGGCNFSSPTIAKFRWPASARKSPDFFISEKRKMAGVACRILRGKIMLNELGIKLERKMH